MEQGEIEQFIIESALKQKMPIPDKIANAPELLTGLELYYDAFLELSTCRMFSMGVVGPIPWTAVLNYAESHGLAGEDDFYLLVSYIRGMDEVFMKHMAKKMKDK